MPRCSLLFVAASVLVACHGGSSGPAAAPAAAATNLRLAFRDLIGQGDHWLVTVPEGEQGRDLDGDGDLLDRVAHVLDLATGSVHDTGLVIGSDIPRGDVAPRPVVAIGSQFALAASESEMNVDLNGDGDALDPVLMVVDPLTGAVTNLGLATNHVTFCGDVLAFGVPEILQGEQDLDGDGVVTYDGVPHFHDLATGETWNSGLREARVLSADGRRVALAQAEAVTGDQNGDGDTLDEVLAFYDPAARTLASSGLAERTLFGLITEPVPHGGRFGVYVDEAAQGLGDLDGDGDPNGTVIFVHDPSTGSSRLLPGLGLLPMPDVAPFVLSEFQGSAMQPWLYDADADRLAPTGWKSARVQSFGDELVLTVIEAEQREDLDGDGLFASDVPVIYDPRSGATQSTGIDGLADERGTFLCILSVESHARHDWNDDGDQLDTVLFVWDPSTGVTKNTRISTHDIAPFGDGKVTLLLSEAEAGADLNGDGDRADAVAHVYDARTGTLVNLGLASDFLLGTGAGTRGFLPVSEVGEERDLDGDGDQLDTVLFLVGP